MVDPRPFGREWCSYSLPLALGGVLKLWLCELWLLLLGSSVNGTFLPHEEDVDFINEYLDLHNETRGNVVPRGANLRFMPVADNSDKVGCAITPCSKIGTIIPSKIFLCKSAPGRKLSCLWTLGLYLVTTESLKIPSITDPHFIDECVKTHNEWRGKVNPPAADMKFMIWDEGLARVAKAWAETCQFKHNTCLQMPFDCSEDYQFLGENIWLGVLQIFSPRDAIVAWYNETEFYNYDNLSCTKVCGHYTQVVWASSYKVGCAITICPNLGEASTSIFVCNYAPSGNFRNQHPYKTGAPCSLCEEKEECVKKLCRNPQIVMPEIVNTNTIRPNETPGARAPQAIACNLVSLSFLLQRIF